MAENMNVLDLPRRDFRLYLDELRTMGADDARINNLRQQYRQKNSFSGILQSLFQPEEGQRRTNILPYSVPENMSLFEAQRTGQAPLLPNAMPQGVLDAIVGGVKALENPGFALTGLLNANEMERAASETATALLSGGLAARGSKAFQVDPNTASVFAGPRSEYEAQPPQKNPGFTALDDANKILQEGGTPKKMLDETGWFVGADGKLRYEIPDKTENVALTSDAYFLTPTRQVDLEDILDHPELYKAYPDLKNLKVNFSDLGMAVRGQYRPTSDSIEISKSLPPNERLSTLLHEVQHAIQGRELFARGSNTLVSDADRYNYQQAALNQPSYVEAASRAFTFEKLANEMKFHGVAKYIDSLDAVIDRAKRGGEKPRDIPRFMDFYKYSGVINDRLGVMPKKPGPERSNWVAGAAEILKEKAIEELSDSDKVMYGSLLNTYPSVKDRKNAYRRLDRKMDKFRGDYFATMKVRNQVKELDELNPFDLYQRVAGETEARNVQNRLESQNYNEPPFLSQDVPYLNQIIPDAVSGRDLPNLAGIIANIREQY